MGESKPRSGGLAMHWQILIAMVLAVVTIVALKGAQGAWPQSAALGYVQEGIKITGQLFLKLLKMIIMPLILASVVMSIAGIGDAGRLRRLGLKTLLYYATTTMLAVLLGLIFVNLFEPGAGVSLESKQNSGKTPMGVADLILAMVPDNVFGALTSNSSILSVIVFALLFGVAIVALGERARPVQRFFDGLNQIMMKLTEWIMLLAPVGVWALLVDSLAPVGWSVVSPLVWYMITVVVALLVHAIVVLPTLYAVFTRRSPLRYLAAMGGALLTAFSTSSSSATLPLTMRSAELRGGVSPEVSRFVLPLGATVNMDGTALYESVAAIFIAQAFGFDLTLGQQVLVFTTATLAAIGAAGVPSAGLVTLLIVLESVGLPPEGYGLIVAVDRLLDMCRTTVNVWGDACGAAIMASTEDALDPENLDVDVLAEQRA